mgnify:CR=1 FL=1
MNNSNLIGRLTNDPEVRYTQTSNTMVVRFILAVNRPYAKPEDEIKADFIAIKAWGKTAEFCSKYFKKGQQIGITGRIETGKYEDKDGKTVYTTEVVAEHVYFADSKQDDNPFGNTTYNDPFANQGQASEFTPVDSSELPF